MWPVFEEVKSGWSVFRCNQRLPLVKFFLLLLAALSSPSSSNSEVGGSQVNSEVSIGQCTDHPRDFEAIYASSDFDGGFTRPQEHKMYAGRTSDDPSSLWIFDSQNECQFGLFSESFVRIAVVKVTRETASIFEPEIFSRTEELYLRAPEGVCDPNSVDWVFNEHTGFEIVANCVRVYAENVWQFFVRVDSAVFAVIVLFGDIEIINLEF